MRFFAVIILIIQFSFSLIAQSPNFDSLNIIGDQLFRIDKLNEALEQYKKAYQSDLPTTQLKAIQGQINVLIQQSKFGPADSLIQIGNEYNDKVDLFSFLNFEIIQGEYYRYSSKFKKALSTFKRIKNKLPNQPVDTLFNADLLFKTALTFERMAAYDSSLVYIDSAFFLFQKILKPEDNRFIDIYNGLGNSYFRNEKIDAAKSFQM